MSLNSKQLLCLNIFLTFLFAYPLLNASPLETGETLEATQASKPNFSVKRGFYRSAFTLTLTTELENAKIIYTMDGSDPTTSTTKIQAGSSADILINPNSTTNRGGKTPGVVIRAATIATGYTTSKVATNTYIFTSSVITQNNPNGIWPDAHKTTAWPGYTAPQSMGYLMNSSITGSSKYGHLMDDALLDIPSYSIVTDSKNLFDASSGIYMNALQEGWERPVSIELIDPTNNKDFQQDAAIRMRGRYSRLPRNPKHSFRILFKEPYGSTKLTYPVFGNDGLEEYDHLDFRTAQNSSWQLQEDHSTVTFVKEIYARDAQASMGNDHTRSYYCHLYLNGMYWGLYQIQERADSKFAEAYLGGNELDYDIIKPQQDVTHPENDLLIGAADGNTDAAQRLWNAMLSGFTSNVAYFKIQGMNADGTTNPDYERLLDVENLIDYLLVSFYTGSEDGPGVTWTSLWGNMVRPNNFIGIYNRNEPDGFKWIVHDMEKCMYDYRDNKYITGLDDSWYSTNFSAFNPLTIHRKLLKNNEYKIKFADRVEKFFRDSALFSPTTVYEMIDKRRADIDLAILGEAARWSWWNYSSMWNAPTKDDWENNVYSLLYDYVPYRTDYVLTQFKSIGIDFTFKSPVLFKNEVPLRKNSITVDAGTQLTIVRQNTSGTIYYTTDGTDPRAIGGEIGTYATAANHGATLTIQDGTRFKARVSDGQHWSPLYEIKLNIEKPLPGLMVTEVHYHPRKDNFANSSDLEFIELKNIGSEALTLDHFSFADGIDYTFGTFQLQPDNFVVLCANADTFKTRYGFDADGQYSGKLSNGGEKIVLQNAAGSTVLKFSYSDGDAWPILADGKGHSLVPSQSAENYTPSDKEYWRASTNVHGSPNQDDPEPGILPVKINEVLTNATAPNVDKIELYNPNNVDAPIGNWFLSDSKSDLKKWQLPEGSTVPANGYLVIEAGHYENNILMSNADQFGNAFNLSSQGDDLYLVSATADSSFTGYATNRTFGAAPIGKSFGTFTNSIGEEFFVAMSETTFGQANTDPLIGPVIISEIMYHPPIASFEYLKLKNISTVPVSLDASDDPNNTWGVKGVDFEFPTGTKLQAGDSVYIIQADIAEATFKEYYRLPSNVRVFPMNGQLSNDGETIWLYQPDVAYDTNKMVKPEEIVIEKVRYNDVSPWPVEPDGYGYVLTRKATNTFANDPASWKAFKVTITDIEEKADLADQSNVYPNPVKDNLIIETPNGARTTVTILDLFGRIIVAKELESNRERINMTALPPGIYLVNLLSANQQITKRVIKQ